MITPLPTDVRVAIIGGGFAGLGMALRLKQSGEEDFVVLERAADVGGTWRDNTYPGAACDVPSHLYSFSFAPNPDWSRSFSPQQEIHDYLRRCAAEVAPNLRFGCEVKSARWDDGAARWCIETSGGTVTAKVLVSAVGALSEPSLPDIPGLGAFEGAVFHSATWDAEHDLTGERVGVIGTGASAIQFVPRIQPRVARLHLFQRTPPWITPRVDRRLTRVERWLYRHVPATQRLARGGIYLARELLAVGLTRNAAALRVVELVARAQLRRQVPDPALRARLTPGYRIGCKRILISNDYYPALSQPNVDVVTAGISEVRARSIVTRDGAEIPVDTIIFGTGFHVTDFPSGDRIVGRGDVSLAEAWAGGMHAHKGTMTAGFPNLYLLAGPNTGTGHTSQVFMIEAQVARVLAALRHMDAAGATVVEVRPEVEAASNKALHAAMARTVWTSGGCASWYLDAEGRNTTLWPGLSWHFRRDLAAFEPADHTVSVTDG